MSEVKIRMKFNRHRCSNHTDIDFYLTEEDCEECSNCRCEEGGYCCGHVRHSEYCPDCGDGISMPYCYPCGGGNCGCAITIDAERDVMYSGTVTATWRNGELIEYDGFGHPHLLGHNNYCLGEVANLFEGVTTTAQAIEAIVTHISNVNFNDGLGGSSEYYNIERVA